MRDDAAPLQNGDAKMLDDVHDAVVDVSALDEDEEVVGMWVYAAWSILKRTLPVVFGPVQTAALRPEDSSPGILGDVLMPLHHICEPLLQHQHEHLAMAGLIFHRR